MSKAQIIAISGAVVLFVLLLLANKLPSKTNNNSITSDAEQNLESVVNQATDALTPEPKAKVSEWKKDFDHATSEQKLSFLDSLCNTWDGLKRPDIAAYYAEQKALVEDKPEYWNKAGERFYNAVRFAKNDQRPLLYQNAINCFEKVLAKEPDNLDAKTNLGACFVEGSSDPMKGIGLLREVVAKDSSHINAQLTLAFFSVKSGQLEKAIERFKKVLAIDPKYIETYLYLADVYEKTGDKQKAIETLEKYQGLVDDVTVKNEVENYINKLKKS